MGELEKRLARLEIELARLQGELVSTVSIAGRALGLAEAAIDTLHAHAVKLEALQPRGKENGGE